MVKSKNFAVVRKKDGQEIAYSDIEEIILPSALASLTILNSEHPATIVFVGEVNTAEIAKFFPLNDFEVEFPERQDQLPFSI
ncbi:MAG TPA: hypothetical protein VMD74_03110 [Candidatus Methylomirabilis sp.]|nr:hypothetical protein [Candidatus Methylomirabilis sp.]